MTLPSLPENLNDLDENEQRQAKELYHNHLVHYHYVKKYGVQRDSLRGMDEPHGCAPPSPLWPRQ